ncbi:MAG: zinc ribbon domain-containing protein [Gemmatimonadota bacterium]|nr:zinc ribbon domain-containing protein [Gemmatimonadota bacterium]
MPQSEEVLERFIKTLVQEITDTRPEYLTTPFTVAEIYLNLVPYRSHRALIGVEMNGDYEEALLQMLSGEGDCLLVDSSVARQEMQRELAGPNPNTALFHEFAAADVCLHPRRVPLDVGRGSEVGATEVPEADTIDPDMASTVGGAAELEAERELGAERELEVGGTGPVKPTAPPPEDIEPVEVLRSEPGRSDEDGVVGHIETASAPSPVSHEPASAGNVSTDGQPSDVLTVCHWCREKLPACELVNYCPFCGSDVRPSPCQECGEAMEARWHFCISCGADVRD